MCKHLHLWNHNVPEQSVRNQCSYQHQPRHRKKAFVFNGRRPRDPAGHGAKDIPSDLKEEKCQNGDMQQPQKRFKMTETEGHN